MATESDRSAVIDTSVLVNFLAVDRVDLLARHPVYRFVLTGHVRGEVSDHYPEQLIRLEAALGAKSFTTVTVEALDSVFVELSQTKRLGLGESAAIAYAAKKSIPIAIDDQKAQKTAIALKPPVALETTETLMVLCLRGGLLTVTAADAIKSVWETEHRFKLPFASFCERLGR
jgi:predicted nucleic acid-binding protein